MRRGLTSDTKKPLLFSAKTDQTVVKILLLKIRMVGDQKLRLQLLIADPQPGIYKKQCRRPGCQIRPCDCDFLAMLIRHKALHIITSVRLFMLMQYAKYNFKS